MRPHNDFGLFRYYKIYIAEMEENLVLAWMVCIDHKCIRIYGYNVRWDIVQNLFKIYSNEAVFLCRIYRWYKEPERT